MEVNDNKEDYISKYKELCSIQNNSNPETKIIKNESSTPVDYVTFTSKFNDPSKMYSISAINEEIEVFNERDDFAANVDPDNIE